MGRSTSEAALSNSVRARKILSLGSGKNDFRDSFSSSHRKRKPSIQKASQEMKKKAQKPYWEMNTEELAAATAELDQEFVIDKCTPLSPEMRARWEKAKRKTTRQGRNAQGLRVVAVRLE